jgi:hypothetical protein
MVEYSWYPQFQMGTMTDFLTPTDNLPCVHFCWPCLLYNEHNILAFNIVFRFIIEYSSSLRHFYRPLGNNNNNNNNNNNRSIFIWGFLKHDDIFWLVLKLEISYHRVITISWRIYFGLFWRIFWRLGLFLHGEKLEFP